MSNETQGKSKNPNWGGARQGAGRPKKTLKRTFTQLQNADSDSQPAPVPSGSGSATHSSFEPATGRSNVIQRTAKKLASTVTGFFGSRASQQPSSIGPASNDFIFFLSTTIC
jgi:hypothetical protein